MADLVGQRLGNYHLVRLLGQGGFADVYLAEHIHLETQVAIKILSMRLTGDNVEHFRTEARTVARLVHPHIVRVLDFGVEDHTPYLAMDYAPNGSLRQHHPKGNCLALDTIVTYVKQIAEGLQYAHDEKLIHRDIKPENILLGRRHDVLLSDFGIALMTQSTRYQNTQEIIGTAAYMAPEQLQGKPRRASDQYSLGIVVYEWICGDRPFHGSFIELYSQHLFAPPPSLRQKLPTLAPDIEQVVFTALAKDPKERFPSVQAFAMALEQAHQVATIPPVTPPIEVSISNQTLLPDDTFAVNPLSQSALSIEAVTPPSQSSQATNLVAPPNQLSLLSVAETPFSTSPYAKAHSNAQGEEFFSVSNSQNIEKTVPISKPGSNTAVMNHHQSLPGSRTVLLIGLALLVIVSSVGFFSLIRANQTATDNAHMNATSIARTVTDTANAAATTTTTSSIVTATAQVNAAATATAYAANSDPYPPINGQLVFSDPLQDNSGGHMWNSDTCGFKNGMLHAFSQSGIGLCVDGMDWFSNLAFEVRMKIIQGNCGGITVRWDIGSGGYDASICQDGTYAFILSPVKNGRQQSSIYLASGSSSQIHTGLNQTNLIAVVANSNVLDLYVNHQKIASVSDKTATYGHIVVFATATLGGDFSYNGSQNPCDTVFSNARVWTI